MILRKKITSLFTNKQSIVVFLLFIIFIPFKTQLNNLLIYAFDYVFTNSETCKVFNLNYTGRLLGCEQVAKYIDISKEWNYFQKNGLFYINYIISLLSFLILFRRWIYKKTFKNIDWFFVFITCFSIFETLLFIINYLIYSSPTLYAVYFFTVLFLGIAIFIFLKIFNEHERLLTIFIASPAFLIGGYFWFELIGAKLLPISI